MIHSVDPVEDAKDDFEALLPFATEIERKHMEAILLHGSAKAAANALGMADTTISRAVKRVRIRAAMQGHSPKHDMVHKVPNPFIVKGVST
ncbi:MAG: hypothetical protein ACK5X3_17570, partial [Pseudomonadota bacterium]